MRPIPAPRLGDTHGLLRAISSRDRVRLDEFITEFSIDELFPPGLENALGRTRQFVSFARSAGLLKEDRGVVELTEVGKRYVRSGDDASIFDVSTGQAEWLRRQLFERHMTDSIYHGAAIGLSLYASNPPDFHVSRLDFGRALAHLGRAGWDNENTLESQGERYTTFLRDLELLDGESRLTDVGNQTRSELTLPVHMSLRDLAGQLNPGGPDAAAAEGEAEWTANGAAAEPEPEPEPVAEEPAAAEEPVEEEVPPVVDTGEYEDVAGAAARSASTEPGRPIPPSDIWETAAPDEVTRAYSAISPEQAAAAAVDPPAAAPPPSVEEEPAAEEPPPGMTSGDPLAAGGMTAGDPLAPPETEEPTAEEAVAEEPAAEEPAIEEPVAEEPAIEEPPEEPAIEEPVAEEPAVEAPVPVVEVPAELAAEEPDADGALGADDVDVEAATAEAALAETGTEQLATEPEPAEVLADEAAAAAMAAGVSAPPPSAAEPPAVEADEYPGVELEEEAPAAPVAGVETGPGVELEEEAPVAPVAGVEAGPGVGLEEEAPAAPVAGVEAGPGVELEEEAPAAPVAGVETGPGVELEEEAPAAPVAGVSTREPSGFLDFAAVKAAAEGDGLQLPDSVYAGVVAALATGKHVVIAGPAGSGKTSLALAIAKAAVQAGRSEGAALATASPKWTAHDTVGRVGESGFTQGHVLAAAGKKKWLIIDELDRAKLDKAFGDLSSFLGGLPLSLPDGSREVAAPKDWRIVATRDSGRGPAVASAALLRRFAEVRLPRPDMADLEAAIDAAAEGDPSAAALVKRLLGDESLAHLGTGAFLDAARYAAERNAISPASDEELEREIRTAYLDPRLGEEDS